MPCFSKLFNKEALTLLRWLKRCVKKVKKEALFSWARIAYII